ncbi:3553_t:CDS:2 [Paraglomus occultum]|uniref:3553_t:CDS:1 n=1 Tax=Paraglomus occultum TaxID=144539 RepID=A0A9N8W5I5_9GLOM|nr:3553_t:CDS:2 [Paraglomus occultum]
MDVYKQTQYQHSSKHILARRALDYKQQYRPAVFRRGAAIQCGYGYPNNKEMEETIVLVSAVPTEPPSRRHWKTASLPTVTIPSKSNDIHDDVSFYYIIMLIKQADPDRFLASYPVSCGDIFCGTHCSHYIRLDQNVNFNLAGFASRVCDKCYGVYVRALDKCRSTDSYQYDAYGEEEGYIQKRRYQREYEQKSSKKEQADNVRERTNHSNNNHNSINDLLESYLKGNCGRYADEPYVEDHNNMISGHRLLKQSNFVVAAPSDWAWSTF